MKLSTTGALVGLATLLPGLAFAQASIPNYEFSSVAVDYPVNATTNPNYSLQGTLGQTFATVDPPTNTNQTLAYAGFGETYVPFAYVAQVALDSYIGNVNPGVTYGTITSIPFTAELWNTSNTLANTPAQAFYADATGKVKVLSPLNPAFAQALSIKGPIWLRQQVPLTPASDPINGYPSASFNLLGGNANGDDVVDLGDFGALTNAYLGVVTDPTSGYDPNTDFNQDGRVDINDFGIMVNNYGLVSDP